MSKRTQIRPGELSDGRASLMTELETWKERALGAEVRLSVLEAERCQQAEVIEFLNAERLQQAKAIELLKVERNQQAEVMDAMKAELMKLKRHVFGRSSEKMPPPGLELRKQGKTKPDPEAAQKRRKDNKEKKSELETQVVDHPVDKATEPACPECGRKADEFTVVGEGRESVVFAYIPAKFIRRVHRQQVLACPCKGHVVVANGPVKLGEGGGNYDPGFVAHLMVSRAMDAIPFNRMETQFQRLGIPMARSTMVDLFHRYANDLAPLVELIRCRVAASDLVLADETPHKMQDKGDTGEAGRGYMWVFIAGNHMYYRFSPSRSSETPCDVLGGTLGTLVVDAYTGYHAVSGPNQRIRAACMAHVRRKFFEALQGGHKEAQSALDFILELYKVEHDAKSAGVARKPEHLAMRKARSGPIMAAFHDWLLAREHKYGPKEPLGNAINHALKNWSALTEFLKSEQTPLDNNRSEAALRIVALSRKNSLFIGNDAAGENLARVLTIGATCQAMGVNPLEYIGDILLRVQAWPAGQLADLLPDSWLQLKTAGQLPPINAA